MATNTKRRIERVMSQIAGNAGTSVTQNILHTAEDAKTLVRMLIRGRAQQLGVAQSNPAWSFVLGVDPRGQQVVLDPSNAESLDNSTPTEEILRFASVFGGDPDAGGTTFQDIFIDTKAMRKMKPGDEIVYREIASIASAVNVHLIVYLWFKE